MTENGQEPHGAGPIDPDPMARCSATSRSTGERCQQRPMRGTNVCRHHGGAAPQVRAAVARREQHDAAEAAVRTYGLPRTIAPDDALLEEVHRTAGHVTWLAAIVGGGSKDDLTQWAVISQGEDAITTRKPSVWVELYQAERKHLVSVCKAAISAGIAERTVKLAEQHAQIMVGVIMAMIDDPELGLDRERRLLARKVVAKHLRVLEPSA